jgi:acetamidase/formamidase
MAPDSLRTFDRDQTTLFFDPRAEPIAEIADGERFVARTADSICGIWRRIPPGGIHIDQVIEELGGACPLTGPFAIEGALRGMVLEVEIHRVDPDPAEGTAWNGVFHGFGALSTDIYGLQESVGSEVSQIPYANGVAHPMIGGRELDVPMRPFLGTIGVAPPRERRMSFSQGPEYLGDVDQPGVTAGATLILPVHVDGGLLSLGDAHGAQGDGEITGVAIEIEAEVEVTVRVRSSDEVSFTGLPQLNTVESIGSIAGLQGVSLGDCARAAYTDLARRLIREHRLPTLEAYQLLGQVGRLQVGNMIDPFYSVVASVSREYLP